MACWYSLHSNSVIFCSASFNWLASRARNGCNILSVLPYSLILFGFLPLSNLKTCSVLKWKVKSWLMLPLSFISKILYFYKLLTLTITLVHSYSPPSRFFFLCETSQYWKKRKLNMHISAPNINLRGKSWY